MDCPFTSLDSYRKRSAGSYTYYTTVGTGGENEYGLPNIVAWNYSWSDGRTRYFYCDPQARDASIYVGVCLDSMCEI
jgi:hypothetical protein